MSLNRSGKTKPNDAYNFRCKPCGKCCDTAPVMTFEEGISLTDVFALQLTFHFELVHSDLAEMKSVYDERVFENLPRKTLKVFARLLPGLLRQMGLVELPPLDSGIPFLGCWFEDIQAESGKCPALSKDGTCTIYSRRPRICRLVPFGYNCPEELQYLFLQEHRSKFRKRCDFSSQSPVIYENGKIQDAETKELFAKPIVSDIGRLIVHCILQNDAILTEHSVNGVNSEIPSMPITLPLDILLAKGIICKDDTVKANQNQLHIITDRISSLEKDVGDELETLLRFQAHYRRELSRNGISF